MTEPAERREAWDPVIFDALLTPQRSLSPRGFVIFMAAVCAASFVAGLMSVLAGAWPVVGFLGLDLVLIYIAFRINYRHARLYETLELTPRNLTVQQVDHRGRASSWRFQSTWLQVLLDDPPAHDSQLTLRSHGRKLVIGAFLTPGERLDLAKALRRALARARCAPRPAQDQARPSTFLME
jgi:uncharacterized membrane protein